MVLNWKTLSVCGMTLGRPYSLGVVFPPGGVRVVCLFEVHKIESGLWLAFCGPEPTLDRGIQVIFGVSFDTGNTGTGNNN